MAAYVDAALELEESPSFGTSPAPTVAPLVASTRAASDATAATVAAVAPAWAFQQPQHPRGSSFKKQAALAARPLMEQVSDDELNRSAAGCSYSCCCGGSALLALDVDACSCAPPSVLPKLAASAGNRLPDGTPLVAATFFADLAQHGSVYQHCLGRS